MIDDSAESLGEIFVGIARTVRRYKSERNLPLGSTLDRLQLGCPDPGIVNALLEGREELASVTRAERIDCVDETDGSQGVVLTAGAVNINIIHRHDRSS